MNKARVRFPIQFSPLAIASGLLVIGGAVLASLSPWFLILVAFGLFGPGILRELGLIADLDEFQTKAAHRAGYHAFLVAGFTAIALITLIHAVGLKVREPIELVYLIIALLGVTWLASSLFSYWGPQTCARRLLYIFGGLLFIFAVVSNVGSEWNGWASLLLHPLLAAPFFALALLSRRFPRISGLLLLGVALFFFQFFNLFQKQHMGGLTDGFVFLVVICPMIAAGVALIASRRLEDQEEAGAD